MRAGPGLVTGEERSNGKRAGQQLAALLAVLRRATNGKLTEIGSPLGEQGLPGQLLLLVHEAISPGG